MIFNDHYYPPLTEDELREHDRHFRINYQLCRAREEILSNALREDDWFVVLAGADHLWDGNPKKTKDISSECRAWMRDNIRGEFDRDAQHRIFVFTKEEDAVAFRIWAGR